ncbi:MAG: DUF2584 family protein [Leptolyngbyaceae cyanobacterium SU_3_3]|nr:DUF2584 family protein [Leptolyngbyaceae cyanobacterium SU_3_3]NJR48867.1 DUF2584 family protein [Leptolyngbyaceae cyanobacterium CSU_1_3]
MGMPCQVNSILKLNQNYPAQLQVEETHQAIKSGYRIMPIDVPISLVDANWVAHADAVIDRLIWQQGETHITFRIHRIYAQPFSLKE